MKKPNYTVSFEKVTPTQAQKWLDAAEGRNVRNLSVKTVAVYANDMRAGHWQPIPVALCFDEDGLLVNGQHRLQAIVAARLPQIFLIARDVSPEVIAAMDQGLKRSVTAVANSLGHPGFTTNYVALTRMAVWGAHPPPVSHKTVLETYMRHQAVIDFAITEATGQSFSMVFAATWARAAAALPDRWDELRHHGRVFAGGIPPVLPGNDRFMYALHKFALVAAVGKEDERTVTSLKTDRQLMNALKKSSLSEQIRAAPEPLFPYLTSYEPKE